MSFNYIWLVIAIIFLVLEAITVGLTCIWFAAGALAAFLVSGLIHAPFWEAVIGIAVSILLLFLMRLIAEKYIPSTKIEKTNFDRIIGMEGIVTEEINHIKGTGAVMVDGKVWTAVSKENTVFKKYDTVRVDEIRGVKVYVSPIIKVENENQNN